MGSVVTVYRCDRTRLRSIPEGLTTDPVNRLAVDVKSRLGDVVGKVVLARAVVTDGSRSETR